MRFLLPGAPRPTSAKPSPLTSPRPATMLANWSARAGARKRIGRAVAGAAPATDAASSRKAISISCPTSRTYAGSVRAGRDLGVRGTHLVRALRSLVQAADADLLGV